MKTHTYSLQLTGRGRFPMDMLRFACAWPICTADAELIAESHSPGGLIKRSIGVTFITSAFGAMKIEQRFESFGWKGSVEEMD